MAAYVQDAIILFGDSLTENGADAGGLSQRLSSAYRRKLDVINRGYSGYNTRWALTVLKQILATKSEKSHVPKVRLLTIWFGANDAAVPPHRQHIPLDDYISNLTALVRTVTDPASLHYSPETKIVLITPPPVNTHQWGAYKANKQPPEKLDRSFEATKRYAEAAREIGEKEGVPVADVWTAMWKAAREDEREIERFSTDGLHLKADGYQIVYDELMKAIAANFSELLPENLQEVFVHFWDIDFVNPEPSLQKRKA